MCKKAPFLIVFTVAVLCFALATPSFAFLFSKHTKLEADGAELLIPLHTVDDGDAHHFSIRKNGETITFFVVKSPDGVIRAAFDACDVCFREKKGYSQSGEFMICNNCGRKFHSNRINVMKGGCNPAPLQRSQRDDNLVIRTEDVLRGARYF